MRNLVLCLTFSFAASVHSLAQKETSFTFSIADGLPSNTVYTIFEDEKNLMWFGTDKGIAQYDGTSFQIYDMSNGLEDLEVFCMEEDRQGRLWFAGFNGRVCFMHYGQVHNATTDPWLEDLDFNCLVRDIHEDEQGRIWFCGESYTIRMLEQEHVTTFSTDVSILAFMSDLNGQLYGKPYRKFDKDVRLFQIEQKDKKISLIPTSTAILEDTSVFAKEESWVFYRSPSRTTDYSEIVLDRFQDLKMIKWDLRVFETERFSCNSTFHNGFYLYRKIHGEYVKLDLGITPETTISWMIEDHQQNLWISTVGTGIIELVESDIELVSTSLLGAAVHSILQVDDTTTVIGTHEGEVWLLTPQQERLIRLPNENGRVRALVMYDDFLMAGTDGGIYRIDRQTYQVTTPYGLRAWKELRMKNGELFGATSANFVQFTSDSLLDLVHERTLCFLPLANNHTIVAHLHGLYDWTPTSKTPLEIKKLGFAATNKLEISQDSLFLFICSNGNGLIIQNRITGQEFAIDSHQGLDGNNVYDIYQPTENRIWIATNKGLAILQLLNGEWEIEQLIKLNYAASSNDIFTIHVTPEKLLFGTANGLYQIQRENIKNNSADPKIYFSSITTSGTNLLADSNHIEIDHTANEITFAYRNDDYSSQTRSWETRLLPLQKDWSITGNSEQSFQELPAGSYTFQVRNKQFTKGKDYQISFVVLPNPLTSWWFISLLWVFVLLVVWGVYRARANRQRAIIALKLKNLEFEQQSLFNQMNPHFIHNSLFAIQGFILGNDRLKANGLLVSFSGLMEKMLFSSKERSITIENEIQLLDQYLSWQQTRLNNAFTYDIITREIAELFDKRIPSMILQPLLENAVEHGIIPRRDEDNGGVIELRFKKLNTGVECILRDNGNQEGNTGKKESLGVSLVILTERLSILRQMGYDASIRIEKVDEAFGTVVFLHLPFLN